MNVELIKSLRVEITALSWTNGLLNPSREVSLAYTNIQRSKAFLGKVLQALEQPNPYPESTDPQSKRIEPQADTPEENPYLGRIRELPQTQLAITKGLRQICDELIDKIKNFIKENNSNPALQEYWTSFWANAYLMSSCLALEEAKMWYGWELDRIRKEIEWKKNPTESAGRPQLPLE